MPRRLARAGHQPPVACRVREDPPQGDPDAALAGAIRPAPGPGDPRRAAECASVDRGRPERRHARGDGADRPGPGAHHERSPPPGTRRRTLDLDCPTGGVRRSLPLLTIRCREDPSRSELALIETRSRSRGMGEWLRFAGPGRSATVTNATN